VPLSLSSKSLLPANWVDSKVVQGLFAFAKSKHSVQINEEPKSTDSALFCCPVWCYHQTVETQSSISEGMLVEKHQHRHQKHQHLTNTYCCPVWCYHQTVETQNLISEGMLVEKHQHRHLKTD
jgi:ferredoxin-like protein FixX